MSPKKLQLKKKKDKCSTNIESQAKVFLPLQHCYTFCDLTTSDFSEITYNLTTSCVLPLYANDQFSQSVLIQSK